MSYPAEIPNSVSSGSSILETPSCVLQKDSPIDKKWNEVWSNSILENEVSSSKSSFTKTELV